MYYTAVEQNDTLTIIEEISSLFEATCSFYSLINEGDEEVEEVELGEFINDEMEPMLQAS